MNWGKKIALAYLAFVVIILTLVVACFQQKDIFLVSDDYYQQELKYQDKINKMANFKALESPVSIELSKAEKAVVLNLTEAARGATGTVTFYRPSNPNMDISFPVNLSADGTQKITTEKLHKGLWVIQLDWQKNNKGYYTEQRVQI